MIQYDRRPRNFPVWLGVLIGVVALAVVAWGAGRLAESLGGGGSEVTFVAGQSVIIEIPSGSSAEDIGNVLADAGVVERATEFESFVKGRGLGSSLQAGTYELVTGMGSSAAVEILRQGPELKDVYTVKVREGLWVAEIIQTLSEQSPHSVDAYTTALLDGGVTSNLAPSTPTTLAQWEGLLFPANYEFFEDAAPADVLQKMATEMELRVELAEWERLDELGVTPYEALIVASLIEAEAKLDKDRAVIGSVIYNRLDEGMLLQIDAMLVYARGERGVPTNADKQSSSPYNSYLVAGLPPTPIASPGETSLLAAGDPDDSTYFFYVLVDPDGSHGFSETLDQHNEKVAKARADGVF
jgi:UPF0755 protein